MAPTASSTLLAATAVLFAAVILAWGWTESRDPREPPFIRSKVPFVGHIIGMIRHGAKYFEIVNAKTRHPIFALPMLNARNYIVTDPTLAGHVQRNSKTLSFYLLIVEVTRRLIAFDKNAARICFQEGPDGLMVRVHEMMNRHFGPGPGLDEMSEVQMRCTSGMLNKIDQPTETSLYQWLRHLFSFSNMEAVYGPRNVFATNPELEESFWQFEDGMLGLVIDVLPQITARKAYRARQRVLDALTEFVREKRYKQASPLIRERIETNLEFGISERMAGHGELVLIFAILGNAVPSLFWLITFIFSKPGLLGQIREEAEHAIELDAKADVPRRIVVSSKQIQKRCPLLYSCYRETLRYVSLLTSPRLVTEDTILGGKYLLRKGSVVQIAGGVIHYDERIWGADVASFNPYRFLSPGWDSESSSEPRAPLPLPKGVPSPAYRAFGGGNVICPGRHFAQGELMATAAVLTMGFDIRALDGSALKVPEKDESRIPLSVMKPVEDPQVCIRRRSGWEKVTWEMTA